MTKEAVLNLLNKGYVLEQILRPDLGTTSLFKPIKRTGKDISEFKINGEKVHHRVGYSIVNNLSQYNIATGSSSRSGLAIIKTYYKIATAGDTVKVVEMPNGYSTQHTEVEVGKTYKCTGNDGNNVILDVNGNKESFHHSRVRIS